MTFDRTDSKRLLRALDDAIEHEADLMMGFRALIGHGDEETDKCQKRAIARATREIDHFKYLKMRIESWLRAGR